MMNNNAALSDNGMIHELRRTTPTWPICAAFPLVGAVTGTIVFSRAFGQSDILSCVEAQRALPEAYLQAFLCFLLREAACFLAVILLSGFLLGWLLIPCVLFYRCVGVGITACCICRTCGLFGAAYALLVLVLPALLSSLALVLAAKDGVALSFRLMRFAAMPEYRKEVRDPAGAKLLRRIPVYAAVIICSSAFGALMRMILHTFID